MKFDRNYWTNYWLTLCALIGLSVLGLSFVVVRNQTRFSSGEIVFREPAESSINADNKNPYAGKVVFQVVGCVKKPGVYQLPIGERIIKAISVAGGPKENADLQAINLAAKIEDGSKIYVPSIEETQSSAGQGVAYSKPGDKAKSSSFASRADSGSSSGKLSVPGKGVVHINSAGMAELQRLPGVGPVTAEKIIEYRSQIGKFTRPEQLMDVKGIGPKKFEQMRPFVAL